MESGPRLGPAQEMGLWGPHRETDDPSRRPVAGGGGEGVVLPEETRARLLQSLIKLCVPQMQR